MTLFDFQRRNIQYTISLEPSFNPVLINQLIRLKHHLLSDKSFLYKYEETSVCIPCHRTVSRMLNELWSRSREARSWEFLTGKSVYSWLHPPQDDMDLGGCIPHLSVTVVPSKRPCVEDSSTGAAPHTQEALRELFNHVSNMPDSAKKKKLIRQVPHPCAHATHENGHFLFLTQISLFAGLHVCLCLLSWCKLHIYWWFLSVYMYLFLTVQ